MAKVKVIVHTKHDYLIYLEFTETEYYIQVFLNELSQTLKENNMLLELKAQGDDCILEKLFYEEPEDHYDGAEKDVIWSVPLTKEHRIADTAKGDVRKKYILPTEDIKLIEIE